MKATHNSLSQICFYGLLTFLTIFIVSCHNDKDNQLTGKWGRYSYITMKPNAVGQSFTMSYDYTLHFDDNGKGHKTEKDITTFNTGENSSYTVEYPFNWAIKQDDEGNYLEIKYLQGDIKDITGENKEDQEQKAKKTMLETSGTTETNYFRIEDDRKLIFHEKGDTATWYYTKKAG